jgi:hypothetical protein
MVLFENAPLLFAGEPLLDDAPPFGDALPLAEACLREDALKIYGVEVAEEARS